MLTPSEKEALRQKILVYQPLFEKNRGAACIPNGLRLLNMYSGGIICWVNELTKIGLKNIVIGHVYFFPPNSTDLDLALNLRDNGYTQYPPLTKKEALAIGDVLNPDAIRQDFQRATRSL